MIVTCSKVQAKNAEWLLLTTTFSYTTELSSGLIRLENAYMTVSEGNPPVRMPDATQLLRLFLTQTGPPLREAK